ncbi:universal stress protein [Longibacter salinarum]|uniref:Universal stress protein n=1 Tax=Longibacter salinarum TaxID=1850348 RepID=A0A2A8D2N4_9BACT|nr:universal stress protein [Longibacter salinarum]PEN15215.1 universal stress protein [Longibacter salinarum]
MLSIKRILFPTDFSDGAARAFPQAAFLAHAHDAELCILSVAGRHLYGYRDMVDAHPMSAETIDSMMGSLPFTSTDLNIDQMQIEGAIVHERIVEVADERDTDLIVMGTHGRTGVNRLLMGSVAEDVVRSAHCPVLTVRGDVSENPPTRLSRILVPVDFSDGSTLAVAHARELALTYGARLDLLHVVEEVVYPSTYGIEPIELPTGEVVENVENALAELAREKIGIEHAVVEARIGYAPASIRDYAQENEIDLIVIATHGRSGLDRLLMGSVTENVVRRAEQPVFVVKPNAKSLVRTPSASAPAHA